MVDLARNGHARAPSAEPAPPAAPDIMELCFAANVVCTPAMYAVLRAVVDEAIFPRPTRYIAMRPTADPA